MAVEGVFNRQYKPMTRDINMNQSNTRMGANQMY